MNKKLLKHTSHPTHNVSMRAAQTLVWASEWEWERQAWFTGQAFSFTREISRATINTAVSFKGAVYHTTTGFEGPQTNPVFLVCFFLRRMSLNTIKCELPLLHFKWRLIDWHDFKTRPPRLRQRAGRSPHASHSYIIFVPKSLRAVFFFLPLL